MASALPMSLTFVWPGLMLNAASQCAATALGGPHIAFRSPLPVSSNSTWYLYGAMQRSATFGAIDLDFSMATDDPLYQGDDLHALHDFFAIAIDPDLALNVAFQHCVGPCNGCSELSFICGTLPPASAKP